MRDAHRDARRWRLAGAAGGPLLRRSAPARDQADRPLDAHSNFRASKPTTRPCTPRSFSRCCRCPARTLTLHPQVNLDESGVEAGLPVAPSPTRTTRSRPPTSTRSHSPPTFCSSILTSTCSRCCTAHAVVCCRRAAMSRPAVSCSSSGTLPRSGRPLRSRRVPSRRSRRPVVLDFVRVVSCKTKCACVWGGREPRA